MNKSPPTSPEALLKTLQSLDIPYKIYNHAPIFTVEEGQHLKAEIPGTHCRNLFLIDKKKRMILITAANETTIDLKNLQERLNYARLSFASKTRLWDYLGIYPGAVTPFCAINDHDHQVKMILDSTMMNAEQINVHPLDNAMTIGLAPTELLRFYTHTGHTPEILDFSSTAAKNPSV